MKALGTALHCIYAATLRGDEVILRERTLTPADGFRLLASLPEDFMAGGRQDQVPQEREAL